ncbi:MAG: exopolysaccharide Pel transporter PelG [Labilithrix sp.]|nr:exopolysaccharide Pel transporter PelG [Labilithrix sp.]MBX3219286.1 exopolysaccharide Pel transporter PelG [Labilithrix sp.]
MAGIGFELRQHLRKDTYAGVLRAYLLAGMVGSGPWLISIGSMLFIGVLTQASGRGSDTVTPFLATVTYLMACSLTLSGLLQLLFVRFIADRLFEKRDDAIAPNLLGAMLVTTVASGVTGALVVSLTTWSAADGGVAFRVLLVATFVTLCNVWLLSGLLSGVKAYRSVVVVFALGYGVTVTLAPVLGRVGLAGYLAGFFVGHAVMLFAMLLLILRRYPSDRFIAFEFLDRKKVHAGLALTGALVNGAVWVDKFVFWMNPVTSEPLLGPIRHSVVYDVPIFVAYLSVIPGMAVFFVRIETDFAEQYERYYAAVRQGETLDELRRLRGALADAARSGIDDIFRIQGLTVVVLLLVGERVLAVFRIPAFYSYLFNVDVAAVGFQVLLLATLTILFYLDCRKLALWLAALFAGSNLAFSIASQHLGPRFYGFGFLVAAALTSLVALAVLSRKLDRLDYETFMT